MKNAYTNEEHCKRKKKMCKTWKVEKEELNDEKLY